MPTTINGTTGVSQIQAGATSDSLPVFQCRAWVNFDGTRDSTGAASTANTNRFIRASGNVASVLRNGTGDYTITFTNAMPDANYAASINIGRGDGGAGGWSVIKETAAGAYTSLTTTAARVQASNSAGTPADTLIVSVAIFR